MRMRTLPGHPSSDFVRDLDQPLAVMVTGAVHGILYPLILLQEMPFQAEISLPFFFFHFQAVSNAFLRDSAMTPTSVTAGGKWGF